MDKINFATEVQVLRTEFNSESNKYFLYGCASSDSLDIHNTKMSYECLKGFVLDCQEENIIVELFHQSKNNYPFTANIGRVIESNIQFEDEKTKFYVKIEVNYKNPLAKYIWDIIENPSLEFGEPIKFGLSIDGFSNQFHYENKIKVYDRVKLKRIAMTNQPSNPDTFIDTIEREANQENISRDLYTMTPEPLNPNDIEDDINRKCLNREDSTDILSTPHTHEPIPERDLRKKTNDLVNELVSSIEIIQNSGLSTHNVFKIIGMFLEKYEDLYEQIEEEVDCCGVDEQQTDTTDINNPSFDDENEDDSALMLRDSSKNTKNNYLERFRKIFEILRESENGEINQQSGNGSTDTTTSGRTETELEHKNKRQTSEGQHTESIIEEKTMETEVKQEIEQVEEKIDNAKVERDSLVQSIAESVLKSLNEAIVSPLQTKLEEVTRELNVIKNQPASLPANVTGIVQREASVIERLRNGQEVSKKELMAEQNKAIRNIWGLK